MLVTMEGIAQRLFFTLSKNTYTSDMESDEEDATLSDVSYTSDMETDDEGAILSNVSDEEIDGDDEDAIAIDDDQ
ncbi:unnamed protein product [Cercopithifilaria johnstoni]|uniref:Uncharacterized protein n=1 Tax=Cercopithifilaria johnstoni TaxID=2874296 RepID=A0A8J2Q8D2_9BILA|nr:unnamed protein product [Cercopithifilaria johnstoni]